MTAAALTNKQVAVLELLRAEGAMTCKRVAALITEATPCGECNGTGDGEDKRWGCRKCYGRGRARFDYGTAYVCLGQLKKRGMVARSYLLDEWGDATSTLMWAALPTPAAADPLERAFRAPSAARP